MLTRRQLLARGSTLLLLTPILSSVLAGCSSDSSGAEPDAGSGSGSSGGTCEGIFSTSTVDDGHSHTVCVLTTDLTNPPAAGVTYTSSSVGHTHHITLTMAQLASINGGDSVTVTSTSDAGHTHNWTIKKS